MRQLQELKKVPLTWQAAFTAVLVLFILFGLGTKLVISLNMGLNSDSVGEGLEAMEIWKHQNYFLSGYYLPADDTFIFTELLPFQLIPQILTNYNPLALKTVSFVIFVLAVAALSYVIFLVSGETVNALLFAALAANLPLAGYDFFAIPTTHIATMVFLGAMLILLLYIGKKDEAFEENAMKRRKKRSAPAYMPWPYIIGLIILTALSALSDSIILTWLVIPVTLAYLLFYEKKRPGMVLAVISMIVVSALAYFFKTNFVHEWVLQSFIDLDASKTLSVNLPLSFKSLAIFLDTGLYRSLDGHALSVLEIASVLIFAALTIYALKNAIEDKNRRFFYGLLLFSGIVMFASFQVMSLVKDLYEARYFTFTALTVFVLIALSFRKGNRIYGALVIAFLLLSAVYAISYVSADWGHRPNAQDYGLITFLKDNNLTYGYGSAFTSNTFTYLSGESVVVRSVMFLPDGLMPNAWLGCDRWYQSPPDKAFILVDNSTLNDDTRNKTIALARALNASEPLHYGTYDIYPINRQAYEIPQASSSS